MNCGCRVAGQQTEPSHRTHFISEALIYAARHLGLKPGVQLLAELLGNQPEVSDEPSNCGTWKGSDKDHGFTGDRDNRGFFLKTHELATEPRLQRFQKVGFIFG